MVRKLFMGMAMRISVVNVALSFIVGKKQGIKFLEQDYQ
jgi:hypothetical protein